MMFGYACNETPQLMTLPIYVAHKLTRRMAEVRKNGTLHWMYPDGKSQVTVEYHYGKPARIHTVLISTQHADKLAGKEITNEQIRKDLIEHVINPVLPKELVDEDIIIFTNPTGRFVVGGPLGDSGLTGRKIIVDTYGGMGRHGGGCFSGKTRPRWTELALTLPVGSLKMLWPPAWLPAVKCSLPMPLVWHSP